MRQKIFSYCRLALVLLITSCAAKPPAPDPNIYYYICLPEYNLRSLNYDPTLRDKNIPAVSPTIRYAGEVGDTVIQRVLFANFAGAKVEAASSTALPFPKTLAKFWTEDVQALLSAQDYETLKRTGGCTTSTLFSAGKALEQQDAAKKKLEAAVRWAKIMESNESRGTTTLTGFPSRASAYLAKDYDVAKLWLFSDDYNLVQREVVQETKKHLAVGLWDYTDPNSIDLVVVKELLKDEDEWVLDRYFLVAPSNPIDLQPTGEIVSMPWPRSDYFFDQRLIYNGISGNTVKFLYREFKGTTNQSSFEQEVNYDLDIGEVIGFKGARFVIHSASNTGIEYSILKPFQRDGVYLRGKGQPQ